MKRLVASACAVAAVVSLAVTGCAADRESGGGGRKGAAGSEAVGKLRDLTYAEDARLKDAELLLLGQCMEKRGYRYQQRERLTLEERRPVGYVQDDVAWARKHGYGSRIEEKTDRARQNDPNLAYRETLSTKRRAAYDAALDGGLDARVISTELPGGGTVKKRIGGCLEEAQEQLYGDPVSWFAADKAADGLRPLYVGELLEDEEFKRAVRAWAQCMRRAGHPYADPGEARDAVRQKAPRLPRDKAFAAERDIAAADATCARETELKKVGKRREAYFVERLNKEHDGAMDSFRRLRLRALARADHVNGPRS